MKKRILYFIPIPIFLLPIIFFLYFTLHSPNNFDQFCQDLIRSQLEKDSLSLHFTYTHPEQAGISCQKIQLPLYSKKQKLAEYRKTANDLATIIKLQWKPLSKSQKDSLSLLKTSLQNDLKSRKYFYMRGAFSPSSGIQIEFPLLMTEYAFYSKEDVSNYLSLLKLFPIYLDSLIKLENERVEKGYGLPDFTLEKMIAQCNEFSSPLIHNPKEHFLVSEFARRLIPLVESGAVTEEEYYAFKEENYDILTKNIVPAYQKLEKEFASFLGTGKNDKGLCHYKEGKDYYEYLFENTTNSSAEIDIVYETLAKNYYNLTAELQKNYQTFQEKNRLSNHEITYFPIKEPSKILTHLQQQMEKDFPPLNTDLTPAKQVKIKQVANNLKKYTAPAYYFVPPLDHSSVNSIYINDHAKLEGISLYTTLAHEGFPGHLYQTHFYSTYRKENNISDIRGILNFGGYVEGWALYTELQSYDYATELLKTVTDKKDYELLYKLYKIDKQSSLALLSLLDIAIHYYGIEYERVCELLENHGIKDKAAQREIYEYIIEEPCNYLKYYWGYMEITMLKNYMKSLQGELFTDYGFHKFILEAGPSNFPYLYNKMKEEFSPKTNPYT